MTVSKFDQVFFNNSLFDSDEPYYPKNKLNSQSQGYTDVTGSLTQGQTVKSGSQTQGTAKHYAGS